MKFSGDNRIVVDWDDTCVENAWPGRATTWKFGARSSLRYLLDKGYDVVIYSTRLAPMEPDEVTPRDNTAEYEHIRDMLTAEGLHAVRIWMQPWKPGALAYIDDKAIRYSGSWSNVLDALFPGSLVAGEPESAIEEAARLVTGARNNDYGHPLDNHTATARMFAPYLERKYGVRLDLDAEDVCWFNVVQKISRDANAPKRDNAVDVAGYAANVDMVRTERERRSVPE